MVEDGAEGLEALSAGLFPQTGRATTVGLTGSPGVGKSTIVGELVRAARAQGRSVAVLAIDPTSPFSGGALLGDRVRMQAHATDPGVFIRSMATRGHLGGMALAAPEAIRVLDAAGHDLVIVETVGVGQAEVDVAAATDTTRGRGLAGLGRRGPGREGRDPRDRRRLRGEQGRSRGLRGGGARSRADAADGSRARRGRRPWCRPPRPRATASRRCGPRSSRHRAHLEASGELERGRRDRLLREVESLVAREAPRPCARAPRRRRLARRRPDGAADRSVPDRRYPGGTDRPEVRDLRPGRRHTPAPGPRGGRWSSSANARPAADAQPSEALTLSGEPLEPLYGPEDLAGFDPETRARTARRVPVHPGRLPLDVPRPAVDDAAVRRVRLGRRDQRALPVPARTRPGRPLGRVRHAHADGPRLGRPARRGRGRVGAAWRPTRSRTSTRCSTGSRSATSRRR